MNDNQLNELINQRISKEHDQEKPTFADRAADMVAKFGGSWLFVCVFSMFFTGWIVFNTFIYQFDHYPFILLNLILSCLAVFQAPFILMSQNRMSDIDRKRDEKAYKTNIKSELELQEVHDKGEQAMIEVHKKLDELLRLQNG